MIVVELVKFDLYLGKEKTKTWNCHSEAKARSVVLAQSSVLRIHPSAITEEKDADGNLIKVVMKHGEQVKMPAPSTLPSTTSHSESIVINEDAAAENEECARLTEKILGENNNLALLIRNRMSVH